MELWMRSQDKEILVKVSNLNLVLNQDDTCEIINYFEDHQCFELGKYKTKERAIEVLDEIQKILKPRLIIKDKGKIIGSFDDNIRETTTYELKELSTYVYEMPNE